MSFARQTWWQLFGTAGAPFRLIMYLANFDDWSHWVNPNHGRNRVDAPLPAHWLIKSIGTPWRRQFSTRINGVTISAWMNDGQEGPWLLSSYQQDLSHCSSIILLSSSTIIHLSMSHYYLMIIRCLPYDFTMVYPYGYHISSPQSLASGPCAARRAVARWSWSAALGPRGCALSWNRCICRQVHLWIEYKLGMGDS
jgi:hypothetical protein